MFSENASSADNQQERVPKDIENLKYYLAGFTDGEGCFSVTIHRSSYRKFGWNINPLFQVYQHKDNSFVLYLMLSVFETGYVSKKGGNPLCNVYCIDKISDLLDVVIPFFDEYNLIGSKHLDFLGFKTIVNGIHEGKHLSREGFIELAEVAFSMNSKGKRRKYTMEEIRKDLLDQSSETKRQS